MKRPNLLRKEFQVENNRKPVIGTILLEMRVIKMFPVKSVDIKS